MRTLTKLSLGLIAAFAYSTALVQPVFAHDLELVVQAPGGNPGKPDNPGNGGGDDDGDVTPPTDPDPIPGPAPQYNDWMLSDIQDAWIYYQGQGTTITVVDDFTSVDEFGNPNTFSGQLGDEPDILHHGAWTLMEASMIAPLANMIADGFNSGDAVPLASGFNVINLSYGMYAISGYKKVFWDDQESSIIFYAKRGQAVISKAAGNDAVAVGTATSGGFEDYLASSLIGAKSAIFVGALDGNGTVVNGVGTASLEFYSNYAGTDTKVQAQFLVVGVESGITGNILIDEDGKPYYEFIGGTGLAGTSFAAPIISGYAAILSSKFTSATPTQVASQLLLTAREDTILNYDLAIHGQGEASISLALSPVSIN